MTFHDNPAFQGDLENGGKSSSISKKASENSASYTSAALTKDVCFVSLGFLCLFTSYQSLANLQSSINPEVGTAAQSVLYAAMVISSLFLPTWLLNKVGVKRSLALCTFGYTIYGAAQAYPSYYTLVPAAFILGIGASPLWTAKCTYLGHVGSKYAELTGDNEDAVITRYFGIFFLFFQSSQVIGNVISSLVLRGSGEIKDSADPSLVQCGINFCPHPSEAPLNFSSNTSDDTASLSGSRNDSISVMERYTLTAVFVLFTLASPIVIMLLVSPLSKYGGNERIGSSTDRSASQQIVATFAHLKNPYQALLVPLTIFSGVEQAFLAADYTAGYVSCGLGIHMVGFTTIAFGVSNALTSYFCNRIVMAVGRVVVISGASFIHAGIIVTLYLWMPNPDQMVVFFIIPAIWGIVDAVWQTQINSLYGVLFTSETEAAFSNYKLWESVGYIVAYIGSTLLCMPVKIYILAAFLVAGFVGYIAIEVKEHRRKKLSK